MKFIEEKFNYLVEIITKDKILLLVLFISFALRVWGIYFDYPSGINFIWDEVYNLMHIFDIVETKDIFVTGSPYPTLLTILYVPVLILRVVYLSFINGIHSLSAFKELLISGGMGQLYIIVRWYSVFFGVASTFLVYKISECIFKNRESAVYSALAYSISLVPVFLAHWGKVHMPMAFFLLLSLYFILIFEKTKKISYFYFSAIAGALSVSSHSFGIITSLFGVIAFMQNRDFITSKIFIKATSLYIFLVSFFYLSNYRGMFQLWNDNRTSLVQNNYLGMSSVSFFERIIYIPRDAFLLDPILTSVSILVIVLSFRYLCRDKFFRYVLTGLLANFLLTITFVAWPKMTRWLLTFVTFTVILGPGLIYELLYRREYLKKYVNFIMILILLPSLLITVKWNSLLNSNTDILATRWLEKNTGAEEYIYTFEDVYMPLSYKAAKWNKEFNKMDTSKINYIINGCEKLEKCDGGYNLIYDRGSKRTELPKGLNFKYILSGIQSGMIDSRVQMFLGTTSPKVAIKYYPTENLRLARTGLTNEYLNAPDNFIELMKLDMSGPFATIYEVSTTTPD